MLSIRKNQMQTLSAYVLKQFEESMVTHLRSRFAKQFAASTEADLHKFVKKGITEARRYQIVTERDVRGYLECRASYGSGFATDPKFSWARKILRNDSLSGGEKMRQIGNYETFVLR